MQLKSEYHPNTNPAALPLVRSVADVEALPWGGNAWWDLPIMGHVDHALLDDTIPRDVRRAMCERAGFLMTGENCDFESDDDFEEHLVELRECLQIESQVARGYGET